MTNRKTRFHVAMLLALGSVLSEPRVARAESNCYSRPWQLRPAVVGTEARLDETLAAFNDPNGNLGVVAATGLTLGYRLSKELTPMLRLAVVHNDAPGAALDGSSFANPLLGVTYTRNLGPYKLALIGATTAPIGTGGGNDPHRKAARANLAAATARPADDTMFMVDYLTPTIGADLAYVRYGFTAQVEATLQELARVRGAGSPSSLDRFRTRAAVGLHLGYFIGSHFSLGADLHYQRWLTRPTTLNAATGEVAALAERDMDAVTVAAGARLHFHLGERAWIHPGLSLVRGFDGRGLSAPLLTSQTTAVQLDVPVAF